MSRFSVKNLLTHSAEKLSRGNFLGFRNILVSKMFVDKKAGEGVSRFSVEISLCHSTGKFIRETFGVSENFCSRTIYLIRAEGGWAHHCLPSKSC